MTILAETKPAAPFAAFDINLVSIPHAIMTVTRAVRMQRGFVFCTVNLDHLVKLRTNPEFRQVYRRAEFISADGWPIVWRARARGALVERSTGADLVEPLCRSFAWDSIPIYLIGPFADVQERAIRKLRAMIPELVIAGAEAPVIGASPDPDLVSQIADRVNASGARVCFVSLGAPKQELLADALARACPGRGFICTGAALAFIGGSVRRAPVFVQRIGLEWLWRLAGQPRALARRYLRCVYVFLLIAIGKDPVAGLS
ncbi:MAG: WecB/TagA/CpsF family glycosyltransferase [Hyphomicrobiales bacterium]|nr:WecB/TagA/CpsF family glycosyltransferase [Hyphomicrobiales bacterium]